METPTDERPTDPKPLSMKKRPSQDDPSGQGEEGRFRWHLLKDHAHCFFLWMLLPCMLASCSRPVLPAEGAEDLSLPPRSKSVRADFSVGPNPAELQFSDEEKAQQRTRGAEIQSALDEAVRSGQNKVDIPPGHYRFPQGLRIRNAQNLEVNGQNSTFWLEKHGVTLENCEKFRLRNLIIDTDPVPFMQGEVVAIDTNARTVDVELDPRFLTPPRAGTDARGFYHLTYFSPDGERVIPMQWDGVTEWQHLGGNRYRAAKFLNNRLFTKPDPEHPVYPGCRVAFSVKFEDYTYGIQLISSAECVIEDVKVYGCGAYAFFEKLGDGGHQYRRCLIGRRPGSGRLLANTRDGFHSYLVRNGPLVEDCDFSRAMDDLVAVHGFFSMAVDWQPDGRSFTLVTPFEPDVSEGSQLAFFDFLNGRILGQAAVVKSTALDSEQFKAMKNKCMELAKSAGLPQRDFTSEGGAFLVMLDGSVKPEGLVGVMSGDFVSKNTVIRRNYLHDTMARGILLKAHGARVESNRIERVAHSGIAVLPESYYMEGPFARDVGIVGNHVEDCATLCYNDHFFEPFIGAIQVSNFMGKRLFDPPSFFSATPNAGVVIQGNTIVRPASVGIFLANTDGAEIVGNTIDRPLTRLAGLSRFNLAEGCLGEPAPEADLLQNARRPFYAIFLLASKNVLVEGNTVTNPPPHLVGEVGIGPWVEGLRTGRGQ